MDKVSYRSAGLAIALSAAIAAPAFASPPDHAPAHGYRAQTGDYPPEYYQRHGDREFRYYEQACARSGEASIGAAIGSLIGQTEIGARIGESLSDCDESQFRYAARSAFETDGSAYWTNPDTGRRGVINAGGRINGYEEPCRRADAEFFTRQGEYVRETVVMCQNQDGSWSPRD